MKYVRLYYQLLKSSLIMCPHSSDLWQRIVTLYKQGEGSIRGLAQRFQVSPDSVRLLVNQYRVTGSLAPKPYTGGPQVTLKAEHHEVLRELVEADNDATLPQLAQRLAERTGVQVSGSTISGTLRKLNLTREKKSQGQ